MQRKLFSSSFDHDKIACACTGRAKSPLAAQALNDYLDLNEWQVAGVKRAMASLDRGESIAHNDVKTWVGSWGRKRERPAPRRRF